MQTLNLSPLNHTLYPALSAIRLRVLTKAVSSGSDALTTTSSLEYEALQGLQVFQANSGQPVELLSLWQAQPGVRMVLPFMTHFADLSSWEFAQKLVKVIPRLQAQGAQVAAVGLGSPANARRFAAVLNFPPDILYADPSGACYTALGFNKGFAPDAEVSPYLKLLPMLAGIGSPGTIQEVARGYFGDRSSPPVFEGETPFNILGSGYQRPFELATLRLSNMVGILPNWGELCPPKTELLTQQGGTLVFGGKQVVYRHKDSGILKYADIESITSAALL